VCSVGLQPDFFGLRLSLRGKMPRGELESPTLSSEKFDNFNGSNSHIAANIRNFWPVQTSSCPFRRDYDQSSCVSQGNHPRIAPRLTLSGIDQLRIFPHDFRNDALYVLVYRDDY
jgi:hypothetical protein